MFENILKGTKRGTAKVPKMKAFGGKEANRWKKEGSGKSMLKYKKPKMW